MILVRGAACLAVQMTLHQHLIDILIGVPLSGLMDRRRTLSKCHRGYTVILRHHDIIPLAEADQLEINGI